MTQPNPPSNPQGNPQRKRAANPQAKAQQQKQAQATPQQRARAQQARAQQAQAQQARAQQARAQQAGAPQAPNQRQAPAGRPVQPPPPPAQAPQQHPQQGYQQQASGQQGYQPTYQQQQNPFQYDGGQAGMPQHEYQAAYGQQMQQPAGVPGQHYDPGVPAEDEYYDELGYEDEYGAQARTMPVKKKKKGGPAVVALWAVVLLVGMVIPYILLFTQKDDDKDKPQDQSDQSANNNQNSTQGTPTSAPFGHQGSSAGVSNQGAGDQGASDGSGKNASEFTQVQQNVLAQSLQQVQDARAAVKEAHTSGISTLQATADEAAKQMNLARDAQQSLRTKLDANQDKLDAAQARVDELAESSKDYADIMGSVEGRVRSYAHQIAEQHASLSESSAIIESAEKTLSEAKTTRDASREALEAGLDALKNATTDAEKAEARTIVDESEKSYQEALETIEEQTELLDAARKTHRETHKNLVSSLTQFKGLLTQLDQAATDASRLLSLKSFADDALSLLKHGETLESMQDTFREMEEREESLRAAWKTLDDALDERRREYFDARKAHNKAKVDRRPTEGLKNAMESAKAVMEAAEEVEREAYDRFDEQRDAVKDYEDEIEAKKLEGAALRESVPEQVVPARDHADAIFSKRFPNAPSAEEIARVQADWESASAQLKALQSERSDLESELTRERESEAASLSAKSNADAIRVALEGADLVRVLGYCEETLEPLMQSAAIGEGKLETLQQECERARVRSERELTKMRAAIGWEASESEEARVFLESFTALHNHLAALHAELTGTQG